MITATDSIIAQGKRARQAARELAHCSTAQKDRALQNIADALLDNHPAILAANELDIQASREMGLSDSLLDRILITGKRLESMAADVRSIAMLPDPVGQVFEMHTRPNGLQVGKKRVPLGVVGAIYENRPNVTIDISALCLKSGNACILRGGREAVNSNRLLARLVQDAIEAAGIPRDAVQLIGDTDRRLVTAMLKMDEYIDLMIPRGGAGFIRFVSENAAMPVVAGGVGVCHTYLDRSALLDKSVDIANNAKTQRPTVCNALDTLLVHAEVAGTHLPAVARKWSEVGVEMRCDERAMSLLAPLEGLKLKLADPEDYGTEFLSLTAGVKIVDSLDEALEHVDAHGSGHSEAIVTEDYSAATRFLEEVDAAAVFVNASTYFCDGAQFGLGAEVGISTQKFHARGPMGLQELTSYKWIILGNGQIRT
jgi:glutamate-5-semialdehyde dehydrogenase